MENKRKLVGYVSDEEIRLLEINKILSQGRDSQFSNWLRRKITEEFGNYEYLKQEGKDLEIKFKEIEAKEMQLLVQKQIVEKNRIRIKTLLQDHKEKSKIWVKYNLTQEKINYLREVKLGLSMHKSRSLALRYKKEAYEDTFNQKLNFHEFEILLGVI